MQDEFSGEIQEMVAKLDRTRLPRHVAIIMDGNGRWAKERGRPRVWGHRHGVTRVREVVELCGRLGVEELTLYAFSEENWQRPSFEVNNLMALIDRYVVHERKKLNEENVKLSVIGQFERLPEKTQRLVGETVKLLATNTGLRLNIALSYGARSEIVRACKKIASMAQEGALNPDDINAEIFAQQLYTASSTDPDLLIRTSGEFRVSNFLLWQIAYAELYFSHKNWPDFSTADFLDALLSYQKRTRRFGLTDDQVQTRQSASSQVGDSLC